jgi:hypothetical protein
MYIAGINFMEDIRRKLSDRRTDATSMSFASPYVVQIDCKERLERSNVVLNFVLAKGTATFQTTFVC